MLRRPRQLSLSLTAWLCFAAGRACWCAGYGPKALLAVVCSSGWLCVFGAEHASGQPWSLIHSSGGLVASGTQAQLAFSPDGTTLAVSSPVAQMLGTDAIALASLGAQPGAVSLYGVSRSGVGLSALLPPLLLQQQGQQQQLPELRLWHQWSLSSTPVGLFVLPSSGLGLLQGKQLQPAQVRPFCRPAGVVKHACVQRQASDVAYQAAAFVVRGGGTASEQPQTLCCYCCGLSLVPCRYCTCMWCQGSALLRFSRHSTDPQYLYTARHSAYSSQLPCLKLDCLSPSL